MLQFTIGALILLFLGPVEVVNGKYVSMCTFTNLAQHRPGSARQLVRDIDPTLCSHIIYTFAHIKQSQIVKTDANDDVLYKAAVALKTDHPHLKVLLSIGGPTASLKEISLMLSTKANRNTFIKSCVSIFRQYGFDGTALDFEYPGKMPDSGSQDKVRFGLLLQEMKIAFEAESATTNMLRLMLTVAVPVYPTDIPIDDIAKLTNNVDYILLLSYDLYNPLQNQTGHHSAMFEQDPSGSFGTTTNMAFGIFYWIGLGVPKQKLIMGISIYGRGFLLTDSSQTGLGASTRGPSAGGSFTGTPGFLAYYEVCQLIFDGASVVWSEEEQVPYLYINSVWISFDNEKSLRNKIRWLKKVGLGGYLARDFSLDDMGGNFCAQGPYPMLHALHDELLAEPVDPLPPPGYLLEYKCGPCVGQDSEWDCDQNDTSTYYKCMNGLIANTLSCASDHGSSAFSPVTKTCVHPDILKSQASCMTSNTCGRSPEAAILGDIGYVTESQPEHLNVTENPLPVSSKGDIPHTSQWDIFLLVSLFGLLS